MNIRLLSSLTFLFLKLRDLWKAEGKKKPARKDLSKVRKRAIETMRVEVNLS